MSAIASSASAVAPAPSKGVGAFLGLALGSAGVV